MLCNLAFVSSILVLVNAVPDGTGLFSNTFVMKADISIEEAKSIGARYGFELERQVLDDYFVFNQPGLQAVSRSRSKIKTRDILKRFPKIQHFEQEEYKIRVLRGSGESRFTVKDMHWNRMWYLKAQQSPTMGVYKAWEMGYSGKGITVAIVDDGLDVNHSDLQQNYKQEHSANYVPGGKKTDPSYKGTDSHGTKVAGVLAATKNDECILGVAFNASFAALKIMEDGVAFSSYFQKDSVESSALSHEQDVFHIYSNSWGPSDTGNVFGKPGEMTEQAIKKGIKQGRNRKGTIYTWAAGNGGDADHSDDCNCDGYANSIYTIAVAEIAQSGHPMKSSEPCTAVLAGTYTGNVTTSIGGSCIAGFSGTSSTCPLAAGIISLLLEASPALSWRDVQHLIVETSSSDNLKCPDGRRKCFSTNGYGKTVSVNFGFGLMNAERLIQKAKSWEKVSEQKKKTTEWIDENRTTNNGDGIRSEYEMKSSEITSLEHVRVTVEYKAIELGHAELFLESPEKTTSRLLRARKNDRKKLQVGTYHSWTFTTVHCWGEDPKGNWKLTLKAGNGVSNTILSLKKWQLVFYGTYRQINKKKQEYPNATNSICTFDEDICDWSQMTDDNFDLERISGASHKGEKTGPPGDRRSDSGFYMLADAGENPDKMSKFRSANFPVASCCISFYYHMDKGSRGKVGRLQLVLHIGALRKSILSSQRGAGKWFKRQIQIKDQVNAEGPLWFEFIVKMGKDYTGDIALDDVSITQGTCK